jgi:beta-glucosidase
VDPLFPFGYGLTYTHFRYGELQCNPKEARLGQRVSVGVWLENVGPRSGEEVVQLYLRALCSRIARPTRELKGFQRVRLEPGERRWVEFSLGKEEIGYWDPEGVFRTEPGVYQVWIAPNAREGTPVAFELVER